MGRRGRERFGSSDEFDGLVDSLGPYPNLTVDQARACAEPVERLRDNAGIRELIVITPHSGDIERHTGSVGECSTAPAWR